MSDAIIQAENAWRSAWDESQRRNTIASLRAEQDAWDAYSALCDEAKQCLTPGCRAYSPQWAYCPEHKD